MRILPFISVLAMSLLSLTAAATPKQLITHNQTDLQSNAFVAGTIPSQYPTQPNSDGKVYWAAVRMACFGHLVNGTCSALIRLGTNTPNPIDIGYMDVNLETGQITPSSITANGYTILVNGPAETTIFKNTN